jgi:Domain of unknown function (DUF4382)
MGPKGLRGAKIAGLLAGAMSLLACSGSGGGTGGTSTLTVSLMDAPVDDVTAVNVEITALWLKGPGSAAKQLKMSQTPMKVNLLDLNDKNAAILIDGQAIDPGSYEWLDMDVNADFDGVLDSFVVTKIGGQEELRVPSGRVRLVGGFDVAANQAVQLLFDWDLRKGLVDPPGQPGFLLKPAFRVVDVHELGRLSGTVALATLNAAGDPNGCLADDPNLDVGNAVYVFAGPNITPDDIDGVDPDPVAVIPVEPSSNGDYVYHTVIAPGTYTIAFTCQAGNDNPDDGQSENIKFVAPVTRTISADTEVAVDF